GRHARTGQSEPVGPSAGGQIRRQDLPRLARHRGKRGPGDRDDCRGNGDEPFAGAPLQDTGRSRPISAATSAKRRHLFQSFAKTALRKAGQTVARPIVLYGAISLKDKNTTAN